MVDYKLCLIRDDTCWKSGYFLAPNKSCGEFCSDASKFACLRIFLLFFYVFFRQLWNTIDNLFLKLSLSFFLNPLKFYQANVAKKKGFFELFFRTRCFKLSSSRSPGHLRFFILALFYCLTFNNLKNLQLILWFCHCLSYRDKCNCSFRSC